MTKLYILLCGATAALLMAHAREERRLLLMLRLAIPWR